MYIVPWFSTDFSHQWLSLEHMVPWSQCSTTHGLPFW